MSDLAPAPGVTSSRGPSLVSHVTAQHGAELPGALDRLLAPFGGWAAIVAPGETIAVKINLLRGAPPEAAVCTHPETLRAVLRALKAAGAKPFVADSPGGLNGPAKVARAYRISGIGPMCAEEGVQIIDIEDAPAQLDAPAGVLYRSFRVGRPFLEADAMIQVGVLKTHQLMRLTGAVKLTYGCIPGLAKAHLHVRAQKRDDFADMLLDLHTAVAPRFSIIDGIIAMEGQGPGNGKPREVGSLFAGHDATALDAALADRTAHERHEVHTLAAAARRGLVDLDDPYRLAGDPIAAMDDFKQSGRDLQSLFPAPLHRAMRNLVTARPRLVDKQACTQCGECETICGANAIRLAPKPLFDDQLCVRCFCCTEVCPTAAIDAVSPWPTRLVGRRH
jgi:uncharacterized protein (DUF362 family)/Pyruvate/2-oxoacid:ferredoxin oxidoreductase delta subunit